MLQVARARECENVLTALHTAYSMTETHLTEFLSGVVEHVEIEHGSLKVIKPRKPEEQVIKPLRDGLRSVRPIVRGLRHLSIISS